MTLESQTKFYDAAIIHSGQEEDVDIAKQFCTALENVTLDFIPRIYVIEGDLEENDQVIKNSTYKFIIVSKNLTREKWSGVLKNLEIMEAIKEEDCQWSLVPVYVDHSDIPFGMKVLSSVDYRSNTSLSTIKELLNRKRHLRLNRENAELARLQKLKEDKSGKQQQTKVGLSLKMLISFVVIFFMNIVKQ